MQRQNTEVSINYGTIGMLCALSALGLTFFFSVDYDNVMGFGHRPELERFAEYKPWSGILILLSGGAVGNIFSTVAAKLARTKDKIGGAGIFFIIVDVLTIIAALAIMLYALLTMTLAFWIVLLTVFVVVPFCFKTAVVRKSVNRSENTFTY